jgi:DNA mismatch endonuclease (patch repair protein)
LRHRPHQKHAHSDRNVTPSHIDKRREQFGEIATEISKRLSAVRSKGNRSTEQIVRFRLVRAGIAGWTLHDRRVRGTPDFLFHERRIALFVDGCFWHGCIHCRKVHHRKNSVYWRSKIKGNVDRDRLVTKYLRSIGYTVIRIWEHELRTRAYFTRIEEVLKR